MAQSGDPEDFEHGDDDAPDAPPKTSVGKKKLPGGKQKTLATPLRVAAPDEAPRPGDWRNSLCYKDDGAISKDAGNAAIFLSNDERWKGVLRYDEFSDRIRWHREPPPLLGLRAPKLGAQLDEQSLTYVQHWLRRCVGPSFSRDAVKQGILTAAWENRFHAVRDYLHGLRWDGTRRVNRWLHTYVGTPDDAYHTAIGRMWLVSAVARVAEPVTVGNQLRCGPGCKVDHMLVLQGKQEALKSSLLRALAGDSWLFEGRLDLRDPVRAAASIQGKWLIEVAELQSFRGVAVQAVKEWITLQVDSYRGAYQEFDRDRPRQSVYAGTTNDDAFLADPTGARRFWCVRAADTIDVPAVRRDRDQLWAEAFEIFMGGASAKWDPAPEARGDWNWWPDRSDAELAERLKFEQDERYDADEWEGTIGRWLAGRADATVGEIMAGALLLEPGKWDRPTQTRVGIVLRRLGWQPRRLTEGSERVRRYYRA